MRRAVLLIAPLLLLLAGCSDGTSGEETAAAAASSSASPTTQASATTSSSGLDYDLDLAVDICTTGLSEPDALVYDAALAARAGTRTVAEIAEMFREAQDGIENQADRAEVGEMPRLAQSLQTYADTLGQARVSGSAGLDEITVTREAINVACFQPAAPAT